MNTSSQHGLTLIEVLIALVIIAVAFVALASSQITSLRVTRDAELASRATQAANEVLEVTVQRVLEDYSSYQACAGSGGICAGSVVKGPFTASYRVARAGTSYLLEGLVLVTVEVSGAAAASLSHYVSCMDVSPPPTVKSPGVCA